MPPEGAAPIPSMQAFRVLVDDLLPYAGSKTAFQDSANHALIHQKLNQLLALAKTPMHPELRGQDYQMTLGILVDLLGSALRDFNSMHPERARNRLHWAMSFCISCHSRLPPTRKIIVDPTLEDIEDAYARARLQYAFREFDRAAQTFQSLIEGYPHSGLSRFQIPQALDYLASIYVRVYQDPVRAYRLFRKLVARKSLPREDRRTLRKWLEDLKIWQDEVEFVLKRASDREILKRSQDIIGAPLHKQPKLFRDHDHLIRYLRASATLHAFLLERPDTTYAAKAAYLLGICYLNLGSQAFTGLDSAYLKFCIERSPATTVAKQCYGVLEESTLLGYSGSSGTHIPADIETKLRVLAKKAGARYGPRLHTPLNEVQHPGD